jgi:hypothetical protein
VRLNNIYNEPNAAIMKSEDLDLWHNTLIYRRLQLHSHLYTSEDLVENFQGRAFKIIAVCVRKEISKHLSENKATCCSLTVNKLG